MKMPQAAHRGHRRLLLMGLGAASLILAGCSSSGSGAASSGSSAHSSSSVGATAHTAGVAEATTLSEQAQRTPTKITQTTPLTAAPPTGKSVIFISNPEPAETSEVAAGKLAAKSLGWTFGVENYDPSNPATLQAALLSALAKHPTYVIETGTPQNQFGASVLKQYQAAGVKIVVGAAVPYQQTGTVIGDPLNASAYAVNGKDIADWFIAKSHGQGHAVFASLSIYPVYLAFQTGFTDEVKRLCSGCSVSITTLTPTELASNGVIPALTAQLKTDSSAKYVVFPNAQYADGAAAAFKAAGLNDITLGGEAIDPTAISAMRAGADQAWASISFYYLGYALIDVAARDITHSTGAAADSIQPRQLVTAANVSTIGTDFNQPPDALAQFQKLWKVKQTPCQLVCG
jgi:hypothetical protein